MSKLRASAQSWAPAGGGSGGAAVPRSAAVDAALALDAIVTQILAGLGPCECLVLAGLASRQFQRCARSPPYWKAACDVAFRGERREAQLRQATADRDAQLRATEPATPESATPSGFLDSRVAYARNAFLASFRDFMASVGWMGGLWYCSLLLCCRRGGVRGANGLGFLGSCL